VGLALGDTRMSRIGAREAVDLASRYSVYALIALTLAWTALFLPSFYASGNLGTLLLQVAVLGILTLGQVLVLLVRGIDLSVSAVMALGAVFVVESQSGRPILLSIAMAIALSVAIGIANGLLVTKRRVPPFVATLGMLIFVEGLRLAYTKGQASGLVPDGLRALTLDGIGPLRWAVLLWLALALGLAFVLSRTTLGRKIYAAGSNPVTARLSGVPVDRVVIGTFVACSLFALTAGLVLSGYIGYVDQHLGDGYNLTAISAAVVGGISFAGGRGTVAGAMAGVVLIALLANIVVVAGLPVELQIVLQGLVLILAVAIQGLRMRISGGQQWSS
jgi:ribose/xylose/arabinose/galactoside ABC-type transport system permease subunit